MKKSEKVLVTFELDNDLYFKMLEVCVAKHWTIDEFVEKALRNLIDTYKIKPKRR